MSWTAPTSPKARHVLARLESLQARLADALHDIAREHGDKEQLRPISWLRDQGSHGGGHRLETTSTSTMNRASLNISAIHYDDLPNKRLSSATALSCIIHPCHPLAPSMHMHISWTELRDGTGGWRMMADLNPSIPREEDTQHFLHALTQAFQGTPPQTLQHALEQGDRYFAIPALGRTRGVAHAYLEQWNSGDATADEQLAFDFGQHVIDAYHQIVKRALTRATAPTQEQRDAQLAYHSLYLFQVLTLDRGTSSGLLVHNQNDVGIMGSLPNRIDRDLLQTWKPNLPAPQDQLLQHIIDALPAPQPSLLTPEIRVQLAQVVREHYRAHPQALSLQARGDTLPPTVANHDDKTT